MTIVNRTKDKVILQSNVVIGGSGGAAVGVTYDNSVSGLASGNVQTAIDEIVNLSGGTPSWGSIQGTLSNQTDLQNALNAKASTSSLSTVATTGNSDDLTEGASQLLMTAIERSKLSGIATGATQNATDAFLLDRGNHTGTQSTSTISGLDTTIDGRIGSAVLGDLSNVDTSGLTSGQIMEFDGSNFVAIPTPNGGSGGAVDSVNGQTGTVVLNLGDLNNVDTSGLTAGQVIEYNGTNFVAINTPSGGSGAVDSVNGQTGTVTLNADDIPDGTTTNKYITQAEIDKLAAIEANATADQSDAEIKTAYENNIDTNAFTNSEQSKLSGVETGATANSTDATLLDRANHTGSQVASTISDFDTAADNRISVASIGLLNNVDLTSLTTGQILEFDGTNFVAIDTPSGGSAPVDSVNGQTGVVSLASGDLTDVDTSTLSSGQILEFDGTNLVPIDTPSGGGGGGATPVFEQDFSVTNATSPFQITSVFASGKNYYVVMEGIGFDWTNASDTNGDIRFIRDDGTFSSDIQNIKARAASNRHINDGTDESSLTGQTSVTTSAAMNSQFSSGTFYLEIDILSPVDSSGTGVIYYWKALRPGVLFSIGKALADIQDTDNTFTGMELFSDETGLVINQGTIKIFEGTGHVTV